METIYFLGIDISKKTLDSALTIDGIKCINRKMKNSC